MTTPFNLVGTLNTTTTYKTFTQKIGTYTLNSDFSQVTITAINSYSITCSGFTLTNSGDYLPVTLEDSDANYTNIMYLEYDQGHSTFFTYVKAVKSGRNVDMYFNLEVDQSTSSSYKIVANVSAKCKASI